MVDLDSMWNSLATIVKLVTDVSGEKLGHTAIMKIVYFLQELRNVPLGYNFRIYTYGPFDSDVLDDLSYAESLEAVKSEIMQYPRGYGYIVRRGEKADKIMGYASDFLNKYQNDFDWVIQEFGDRTASDLELLSTIIYVDLELSRRKEHASLEDIGLLVRNIKPHFSIEKIQAEIEYLKENKLIEIRKNQKN